MADLKVHTRVSLALHPDILSHRAPVLSGRSASAFTAASQTLEHFYRNQSLILNARDAEFAKLQSPNAQRALQLAREGKAKAPPNTIMRGAKMEYTLPSADAKLFNDAAEQAFRRGASIYDQSRAKIVTELEQLILERAGKTTDPSAKTPAGIAAAAEIRAHLKSLPASERGALVREQIAAGNARVAAAVAESESFLSGFDPATHANLVAATRAKFAPEESAKIEALSAVLKNVDDAATVALNAYTDSLVPVLGLNDSAAAAMSALKTGGESAS
jgi:hypothetical protein